MRIGVYMRVSTPNQMQKQTIDQQLYRLRVFLAEQHEDLADDHIYRDDGYSGAHLGSARPGSPAGCGPRA